MVALCGVLILILFTNSLQVSANGLEWAVEEGDTFDYILNFGYNPRQMNLNQREFQFQMGVFMNITALLDLSSLGEVSSISRLTYFFQNTRTYLSNGTSLASIDSGVADRLNGRAVIPVGNWTLFSEVLSLQNSYPHTSNMYTEINDDDYWGYIWESSSGDVKETWKWLKSDGTLSSVEMVNSSHEMLPSLIRLDLTLERTSLLPLDLIIIGVSGVLITIIALVIYTKRKT